MLRWIGWIRYCVDWLNWEVELVGWFGYCAGSVEFGYYADRSNWDVELVGWFGCHDWLFFFFWFLKIASEIWIWNLKCPCCDSYLTCCVLYLILCPMIWLMEQVHYIICRHPNQHGDCRKHYIKLLDKVLLLLPMLVYNFQRKRRRSDLHRSISIDAYKEEGATCIEGTTCIDA